MGNLSSENYKTLSEEIKQDLSEKISYVHGSEP